MKKNLFLVVIFCALPFLLTQAQTQTEKGKTLLGVSSSLNFGSTGSNLMSLGFSTTKSKSNASGYQAPDPEKSTSFNLIPRVGYFFIQNFVAGLDVSIASVSYDFSSGTYKSTSSTFLYCIGPFARYYVPTGKVLPFFELGTSVGSMKNKSTYGSSTNEDNSGIFIIGGSLGIAAPLGDRASFDVSLGYNSMTVKAKENNPNNERTITGTVGLKLGFSFYLGKD
jgi:hypothetical protein